MTMAEFWSEQYRVVVADKKTLGEKLREALEENKELKQQLDKLKNRLTYTALKNMEMEIGRLKESLEGSNKFSDSLQEKLEFTKAELEAKLEDMTQRCDNITLSLRIVNERLDKSIADRKELQADRDFWVHDSAEKTVEIQSLKAELNSIERSRDTWRIEAERLRKEITESYSDGYSDGNEEGQNELWEMLQLINDVKPFEAPYFEDVTGMNDIISWDLEDFKEAYDKWEAEKKKAAEEAKKKHVEYMREYLKRYCIGRLCVNCPLYDAFKPVSSCLFSKLTDEEVEKRYRKAVDSEYKKTHVPVSARLPQPWECTIEAKVEINEAVLNTICGTIKDNKEEES